MRLFARSSFLDVVSRCRFLRGAVSGQVVADQPLFEPQIQTTVGHDGLGPNRAFDLPEYTQELRDFHQTGRIRFHQENAAPDVGA